MRFAASAALLGVALLGACELDFLESQNAQAALDESIADSEGIALTAASIELGAVFTMGQSAQQSAEQLREMMSTQLGCGGLRLEQTTVSVEYATCNFEPNVFAGTHSMRINSDEDDPERIHVTHTWDHLSNGHIEINGSAEVTWSVNDPTRHVVDDYSWVRKNDGRHGTGGGDRYQGPLPGHSVFDGLQAEGNRTWDGSKGHWELAMGGIKIRWVDPVPYTGLWTLKTPSNRMVSFEFERIDAENIGVKVVSGELDLDLNVDKLGFVSPRPRKM